MELEPMGEKARETLRIGARDRLAGLEALAADRPPHAMYLARLIRATAVGLDPAEVPLEKGVSNRAGEAILDDYEWIAWLLGDEPITGNPAQYPATYAELRRKDAERAHRTREAARRKVERDQETFGGLFSFRPGKDAKE